MRRHHDCAATEDRLDAVKRERDEARADLARARGLLEAWASRYPEPGGAFGRPIDDTLAFLAGTAPPAPVCDCIPEGARLKWDHVESCPAYKARPAAPPAMSAEEMTLRRRYPERYVDFGNGPRPAAPPAPALHPDTKEWMDWLEHARPAAPPAPRCSCASEFWEGVHLDSCFFARPAPAPEWCACLDGEGVCQYHARVGGGPLTGARPAPAPACKVCERPLDEMGVCRTGDCPRYEADCPARPAPPPECVCRWKYPDRRIDSGHGPDCPARGGK